jgi:hypothetical protein
VPLAVAARLCDHPAPTLRALGTLARSTGAVRGVVVESPTCPWTFRPQAYTAPVPVNARAWAWPAASCVTWLSEGIATGVSRWVVVPSPS